MNIRSELAVLLISGALAAMEREGTIELQNPEETEKRRRERAEARRLAEQERITIREAEERRRKAEYEAKAAPYREERARRQRESWLKQHPEAQ